MSFSELVGSIIDIIWNIPIYVPIISLSLILLTYILNKDRLWTIPKLSFLFAIVITIYDITTKTPGENIFIQFKNYIYEAKYNYNFLYIYIPIFLYCLLIAAIFGYIEKVKNKISVKSDNLPK
ncbi:MAG TPA: hypothetical protein VIO64_00605 [Pseudobacteroides sp.]|uniref:hypothetical protein n=1 Tax=Pseudobacteroides sp. TaxID=1968840 RepID=UPI002F932FD5